MKLAQVLKEEQHVYMMCIPEMHNVCGVGWCQGGSCVVFIESVLEEILK